MSKKDKNDIENEQVESAQTEAVEVEEQVEEEQTVEEKLEGELKQEKDKFLRLFAEFENYKRRTAKERLELFSTASEDVMKTLLPVLDDFERALTHIEDDKEAEELRKGVLLIYQKLVKTLEQKNLLFVAASGNEFLDLDNLGRRAPVYPASLNLKNQITVGAIGFFGNKVGFSNYGHNSVELFAPGSEIITLAPNSGNTCYDGTSFAAPIVSGALALLIEAYPDASLLEIKNLILNNVRSSKNYINLTNGTLDLGNL